MSEHKSYWTKPSHFPPVCWMIRESHPEFCIHLDGVSSEGFFYDDENDCMISPIEDLKEYRWLDRPFDRFEDGKECLVEVGASTIKDLFWQVRDLLAFMEARQGDIDKGDIEPRIVALEETLNELDPEGSLEGGKPRYCACKAPLDQPCELHFGKCCDCLDKEPTL